MRRLVLLAAVVVGLMVVGASVSTPAATPRVSLDLKPPVGPPTTTTKVKGSGFAARELVVLFFDGTRVGSSVAGPTGKFNTSLVVPAAARPGGHTVEAIGESSGVDSRALFLVRTDWLQGCFGAAHGCFNPYENVLGPGNAGALTAPWRAAVGTDGLSSPVYANGKLFVGTAHGLAGLDPATGAIIINFRTGPVSTTPAVIRGFDPRPDPPGKVIFGTTDGNVYAVSTDGVPLWQAGLGRAPATPLVIQGIGDPNSRVIVGAGNVLYAFDGTGNRQWATVLEGGDISTPPALLSPPGVPDRVVVAAGNTLYLLDAATGAVVWASTPSGRRLGAAAIGDPTIVPNPNVLVGDQAGTLFSLDPSSGRVKATFAAGGPVSGSPAIGDPNDVDPWVILGDGGGNIYAADQTDDFPPPIWQAALPGPVDGPPVLANGVVYVATDPEEGTDPHLFALDQASGRVLFDSILTGGIAGGPIVADGRVIVATRSGDVIDWSGPGDSLVATQFVTTSPADAGRPASRLAPSCLRDTGRSSACQLITGYFHALNTGRDHRACALLGSKLRRETGGPNCPQVLALSRGTPFHIDGARTAQAGVKVFVTVGLHELDHWRMLRWTALVGSEAGQLKILDTTL